MWRFHFRVHAAPTREDSLAASADRMPTRWRKMRAQYDLAHVHGTNMFVRKRPNVNLPIHMELNEVAKFELHRKAALISCLRLRPFDERSLPGLSVPQSQPGARAAALAALIMTHPTGARFAEFCESFMEEFEEELSGIILSDKTNLTERTCKAELKLCEPPPKPKKVKKKKEDATMKKAREVFDSMDNDKNGRAATYLTALRPPPHLLHPILAQMARRAGSSPARRLTRASRRNAWPTIARARRKTART